MRLPASITWWTTSRPPSPSVAARLRPGGRARPSPARTSLARQPLRRVRPGHIDDQAARSLQPAVQKHYALGARPPQLAPGLSRWPGLKVTRAGLLDFAEVRPRWNLEQCLHPAGHAHRTRSGCCCTPRRAIPGSRWGRANRTAAIYHGLRAWLAFLPLILWERVRSDNAFLGTVFLGLAIVFLGGVLSLSELAAQHWRSGSNCCSMCRSSH